MTTRADLRQRAPVFTCAPPRAARPPAVRRGSLAPLLRALAAFAAFAAALAHFAPSL
jgi:hypothetical protein